MNDQSNSGSNAFHRQRWKGQLAVRGTIMLLLILALLSGCAGRLDWTRGWRCAGLWWATLMVNLAILLRVNPAVVAHRLAKPACTESFDRVLIALILGYAWTFVPVSTLILLFVVRTTFEDRLLRSRLPGYAGYARQTRFRLLPWLW